MRGLNLDREKGTFEWVDPDAPAVTFAEPEAAPTVVAAQPPPVEAPPLRVDVAQSQMHSPLSLSQVAGVHSRSPSPLTPDFGLDAYMMDVDHDNSMGDPPTSAQTAARTSASPSDPQPSVTQMGTAPVENEGMVIYTWSKCRCTNHLLPARPAEPPAARQLPLITVQPIPASVGRPDVTSNADSNFVPPRSANVSDTAPASPVTTPPAVEERPVRIDEAPPARSPLPSWSPLRSATPPTLGGGGRNADAANMDVADGGKRVLSPATPLSDLAPHEADDVHAYNVDGDTGDNMDDLDDLDADFLRYPSSPSGSPPVGGPGPTNSVIEHRSTLMLYPLPGANGALESAQEEEELEFDETDYIRSRLPSPFVMTPTSQPLELPPKTLSEPPIERVPTPQPMSSQSESSESIRSSSSPEPRFPEPQSQGSIPPDPSAEERLPSPPPDSDEEEVPPEERGTANVAPAVGTPTAANATAAAEAPAPVEVAHILPLSPADAIDEFPPGFHFIGMPQGTSSHSNISHTLFSARPSGDATPAGHSHAPPIQNITSPSLPSEGLHVRTTAVASRVSVSPPINGRDRSLPVDTDGIIAPTRSGAVSSSTRVTAETVLSTLPQTDDSKRVKLEIMTVSLSNGQGDNGVIEVEGETDMDIETPIDVDMEDRTPSPLPTPAVLSSSQRASPPLSASHSLFTPDATPRSVTKTAAVSSSASHAAGLAGAPGLSSPSPASAAPPSLSSQNQSNDYMVAPGLSTISTLR